MRACIVFRSKQFLHLCKIRPPILNEDFEATVVVGLLKISQVIIASSGNRCLCNVQYSSTLSHFQHCIIHPSIYQVDLGHHLKSFDSFSYVTPKIIQVTST